VLQDLLIASGFVKLEFRDNFTRAKTPPPKQRVLMAGAVLTHVSRITWLKSAGNTNRRVRLATSTGHRAGTMRALAVLRPTRPPLMRGLRAESRVADRPAQIPALAQRRRFLPIFLSDLDAISPARLTRGSR
jgi:hypothetical protein